VSVFAGSTLEARRVSPTQSVEHDASHTGFNGIISKHLDVVPQMACVIAAPDVTFVVLGRGRVAGLDAAAH